MTTQQWQEFVEEFLASSNQALSRHQVPHLSGVSFDDWYPEATAIALYWGAPTRTRPESVGHSVSLKLEVEQDSDQIKMTVWAAKWRDDFRESRRQLVQARPIERSLKLADLQRHVHEVSSTAIADALNLNLDSGGDWLPIGPRLAAPPVSTGLRRAAQY